MPSPYGSSSSTGGHCALEQPLHAACLTQFGDPSRTGMIVIFLSAAGERPPFGRGGIRPRSRRVARGRTPVVAARSGATSNVLPSGSPAVLFEPDDEHGLRHALEEALVVGQRRTSPRSAGRPPV